MRIVIVSEDFPPETASGGIGTQAAWKAAGLAARGHDVRVLSASADGDPHETSAGSVRVLRIPGPEWRQPIRSEVARWLGWSVEVARALERMHGAEPWDVVEFPEWGAQAYAHVLNRVPDDRAAVVIQLHGPAVMLAETIGWPDKRDELYLTGTHMEGTCLRRADAVYSSSDCSTAWCARSYGLDAKRIPTIHGGVDTTRFRPASTPTTEPVVTFVGRLAPNKGVEALLEACLTLAPRHPNLSLRVIGKGDDWLTSRLIARARDAGHAAMLELVGFVAHDELPAELQRAQVFASPSEYEGGPGLVFLEAMACGLPVVGCAGSGSDETLIPEVNAVVVPPRDTGELARALGRLLADEQQRRDLGQRARAHVVANADSERCLDRLELFLFAQCRSKRST